MQKVLGLPVNWLYCFPMKTTNEERIAELESVIEDTIASLKRKQDASYRFRDEAMQVGKPNVASHHDSTGAAYGRAAALLRSRLDGQWAR